MSPTVAVLDYGFGNVRSAVLGGPHATLSSDFDTCLNADGLIIPGVGAFAACMQGIGKVRGGSLVDARLVANRPVLGICVGMQIMFAQGIEHGISTDGLAQWPGVVDRLVAPIVPHMGWNGVTFCTFLCGPELGHERYRCLSASSPCQLEQIRDPFYRRGREWPVIGGAVPSGEEWRRGANSDQQLGPDLGLD
jgi:hypothetical protein